MADAENTNTSDQRSAVMDLEGSLDNKELTHQNMAFYFSPSQSNTAAMHTKEKTVKHVFSPL